MRFLVISLLISLAMLTFGKLVVYTYDSMISGLAKYIEPMFEAMYGEDVVFMSFGDAGAVLSRLILEGDKTEADIILGLDQNLLLKAEEANLLLPYKPLNWKKIKEEFIPEDFHATPFDFGAIAVVYNSKTLKKPPTSFEDLLNPEYKRKLVVEDPRTSSTGLAFLLWTIAVYGDDFTEYWRKLRNNILTVTPGWDEAFEMLESGEADMMVSYATDEAYSYHYYRSTKFKPVIMKEGAYVQVEYVGIVKYTDDLELAKRFVEFMLSDFVQKEIPLNQWMFPITDVKLPEIFVEHTPKIEKVLSLNPESVQKNLDRWLKEWTKVMTGF